MKITPADKWFSLCVRERAGWKCEYCGTQYEPGSRGLHCSHYFTRGNWAVRFEPLNAFAHCFHCHQLLGSNPDKFYWWVKEQLGEQYRLLIELERDIVRGKEVKRTKGKGEIADHYEAEYCMMRLMREAGAPERLEFKGWL